MLLTKRPPDENEQRVGKTGSRRSRQRRPPGRNRTADQDHEDGHLHHQGEDKRPEPANEQIVVDEPDPPHNSECRIPTQPGSCLVKKCNYRLPYPEGQALIGRKILRPMEFVQVFEAADIVGEQLAVPANKRHDPDAGAERMVEVVRIALEHRHHFAQAV